MEKSIFNKAAYNDLVDRIKKLTPSSQAAWGKMNVAQMLAHCNYVHEQALEKIPAGKRPPLLFRWLIKKLILSPKPYKQGLPTGKELVITEEKDFEAEKKKTLQSLEEIYNKGVKHSWPQHPAIGKISGEEWGYAIWKHLDHHLRQFSV